MKFKYWILVLLVLVIVLSGCPFQNKLPFWTSIPDITKDVGDSISFSLAAYCSDPDGDPLTFSIAGGPGSIVGENYTWTVALPQGERLVAVSVSDGKSSSTKSFKIIVKTQPNVPSSPCPNYGASEIPYASVYLSWTGGDPDGDSVTYDLYFGTSGTPPLYASNLTSTGYNKTDLKSYTVYSWKIVAKDGENEVSGPLWVFTTGPYILVTETFETRPVGVPNLPWAEYESFGSTAEITGMADHVLTFYDDTVAGWAQVVRTGLNPIKKASFEFKFKASTNCSFAFRETATNLPYLYIGNKNMGYGIYSYNRDSGEFTKVVLITGNERYEVSIDLDLTQKVCRISVNDVLNRTELLTYNYSLTSFNFQVFSTKTCARVDIDDVEIRVYESGYSP